MPIILNGTGTISGLTAGGLPDGVITTDDIAASAITRAKMGYAGAILQVVSTTKTDSFSTTGTAFSDITGLSVTITPSSTSSKILITCSINGQGKVSSGFCALKLVRGSTDIAIADAFSSAARATSSVGYTGDAGGSLHSTINYLDSPATTSAITYKVQGSSLHSGVEFYINRTQEDNGAYTRCRTVSTITAMEVAG